MSEIVAGTFAILISFIGILLTAEISLATPTIPKQSARLGVTLISIITSLRFKYSRMSFPKGALSGNSIIPL